MALRGCIPWNKGKSCTGVLSTDKVYARAYYANNREKLLADTKDWQSRNQEKVIAARKKYRQKAKDVIVSIKETTPCTDCNVFYPAVVMDFDHVHGNKEGEISAFMRSGNLERALEEIKKVRISLRQLSSTSHRSTKSC